MLVFFFVEKETTSPPHAPVLESGLVIIIKMSLLVFMEPWMNYFAP